jgi:L-methionine (R)-S-oxide reductase
VPLFGQSARTQGEDYLLGVLDLDSPKLARFDEDDRRGLESLAAIFVKSLRI